MTAAVSKCPYGGVDRRNKGGLPRRGHGSERALRSAGDMAVDLMVVPPVRHREGLGAKCRFAVHENSPRALGAGLNLRRRTTAAAL
jgi:hypothetical protein